MTSKYFRFPGWAFGEHIQVKDHITLEMVFVLNENAKATKVKYLVVGVSLPYNIIVGRPTLNLIGAAQLTLHLSMKYLLPNGWVRVFQEDQTTAQEGYQNVLK